MRLVRTVSPWLLGAAVGAASVLGVQSSAQNEPPYRKTDPPYRGLDANLFVQTSAEYRACCYQAFNAATSRLNGIVACRPRGPKPFAVVLDLDEMVIDNRGYQTAMLKTGLAMDARTWDRWEKTTGEIRLIPGAAEFLAQARAQGVAAVYISNRTDTHREAMHADLARLEIDVPDGQLLLRTGNSGDKTARRQQAAEAFDIVLLVGDNLRDLDERFAFDPKKGIDGRFAEVDATRDRFLTDWIILPNPVYGDWTRPFHPRDGKADVNLLTPTKFSMP